MLVSVIIPVLNEGDRINNLIAHIKKLDCKSPVEIIVVDGDKKESTCSLIKEPDVIKLTSSAGRALQMNEGAKKAAGEVLLFLHCDTFLPANAFFHILETIENPKYMGGAFDLGFDNKGLVFSLFAFISSLRSRITRIPFGDQAFFINAAFFREIGCFREFPLMEDVEIMQRIKRKKGRINISAARVTTSARKWENDGILYTTLRNWALQFLFYTGTSPDKLVSHYYKNLKNIKINSGNFK